MATIEARIKEHEEKLKQLKALHQKQLAQKRAAEAKKERAADTRRKVLIGAMYLDRMEKGEEAKKKVLSQLDRWLTRADDRALFDLPALPATVLGAAPTGLQNAA